MQWSFNSINNRPDKKNPLHELCLNNKEPQIDSAGLHVNSKRYLRAATKEPENVIWITHGSLLKAVTMVRNHFRCKFQFDKIPGGQKK